MFDPKCVKFPYTAFTDGHYLKVKKDRGIVFDEHYPYVDESKRFCFISFLYRVLLVLIVFPVTRLRLGLKIEGKENLKQYRDVIDGGVVSVCNHVHLWDYLAILSAVSPKKPYVLVWAPNINGETGVAMRHVGGIPIPVHSEKATRAYLDAIRDLLENRGWLHIYAEGSMWEYYAPIRPFKRGAAFIAAKNNKPILPFAFSYRRPSWIRRTIFRQTALFTLHIGEPLFPDRSLSGKKQQVDLTERAHQAVCRLAGFDDGENLYPPVFEKNVRIDYYTDAYGIGYKGSH